METQRTLQDHSSRGRLLLADGDIVEGISFGAVKNVAGEVVFNTGMVGYPEALTDPSYRGQILILTTPMVGNYGVPPDTIDEHGLPKYFEGREIHVAALIVTDYSVEYSHWNAAKSLSQWLKESGVPALYGVDTRRLTKRIRDSGAQLGKILFNVDPQDIPFDDPNQRHLVREVSIKSPRVYNPSGTTKILAFDCGIKYNIIRYVTDRFIHILSF